MNQKYVLKLTADERAWLEGIVRTGKCAAWKIQHAHALLKMDQGEEGPGWDDVRINGAAHTQKNDLKPWLKQQWCIAPEHDADFACQMEQVLEVYCRPYDARYPVICMDEQPKQLIEEVRVPTAARAGEPAKEDFEYIRHGVCVAWMFVEPLAGWRTAPVSERKTALDWAQQVKAVVDAPRYAQAERIVLVSDNLNTHRLASLYEAFPPAEALRLARKLELVHTPKHGSWLNMAEPELSVLTRQCLDRRIAHRDRVADLAGQWAAARNQRQTGIDWQFRTADARMKLKYLYPKIEE